MDRDFRQRRSDAVHLDFSKAFDSVPHKRLLIKLQSYGVEGKILQWIQSFLSDRRHKVYVSGAGSSWSYVTSGVPQGSYWDQYSLCAT